MKVEMKLYKSFDADFIALNENGISVPKLMKTVLEGYVRGNKPNIYIPQCKGLSLDGKKRYMHIAIYIDDEKTIDFLKTKIKYRQRSAFIKTLTRSCIITPQVGVYFDNEDTINSQTRFNNELNLEKYENLYIANFDNTIKKVEDEYSDKENTKTNNLPIKQPNDQSNNKIEEKEDEFQDVINLEDLENFKLDEDIINEIEEIKENNDINDNKNVENVEENLDEDSLFNQFLNMRS